MLFLSSVVLHISAFVCSRNVICFAYYKLSPWHVSLIIRALWYCHHGVRYFADYHSFMLLVPWDMSLSVSALARTRFSDYHISVLPRHGVRYFADYRICMLHSAWNMSCWLSALAVTRFADYHSSVLLLPWREIIHWLSEPCRSLAMTSYHSLNAIVAKS